VSIPVIEGFFTESGADGRPHLLVGELHRRDAVRLERITGRIRRWRREPVVGERPQRPGGRQLDVVEVGRAARRVAAEGVLLREVERAAHAAAPAEQAGLTTLFGEVPVDDGDA